MQNFFETLDRNLRETFSENCNIIKSANDGIRPITEFDNLKIYKIDVGGWKIISRSCERGKAVFMYEISIYNNEIYHTCLCLAWFVPFERFKNTT